MAKQEEEFDSPVDFAARTIGGNPLRWTTLTMAVAALVLLVGNAISLRQWVEELTPSPAQQTALGYAVAWEDLTGSLGLGSLRATLHRHWKAAEEARFDEEPDSPDMTPGTTTVPIE